MRSSLRLVSHLILGLIGFAAQLECARAQVTITPTKISFGTETVGLETIAQYVTVSNGTSSKVTVSSFSLSLPQFQVVQGIVPISIPAGGNAHYEIVFAPTAQQQFPGKFTVNVTGQKPLSVGLTGTGKVTGAIASVSPIALGFGSVPEGTSSSPQSVTITNTGTSNVTLLSASADPPFSVTAFTSTVLQPGNSTQVQVALTPDEVGNSNGELTLTYDVLPTQGVDLTGSGTAAATLAVTNFPQLAVSTRGAAYSAQLSAAAGTSPYTWTALSSLPAGLTLSSSGLISGTVSKTGKKGAYTASVQVQDSSSPPQTATQSITIPVSLPSGASCNNISWDVSGTNTPIVPIDVLGAGTYLDAEGGLYPDGSNTRPGDDDAYGVGLAQAIVPLNSQGQYDPDGKEVVLLLGSSEAYVEGAQLATDANADPAKNPAVVLVNGAQGQSVAAFAAPGSAYWNTIMTTFLPNAGVNANQVVAAWFEPADAQITGTFPDDISSVTTDVEDVARDLLTLFPNIKLVYFSSRAYGGYANGLRNPLNPEPYAYEDGFAVKWAIQDQLDGDPSLNYNPQNGAVTAPWMSWGPYYWGNGLTLRPDGLAWSCPDFVSDGNNPSNTGVEKVANELLNFFESDDTTTPWFLAPQDRDGR